MRLAGTSWNSPGLGSRDMKSTTWKDLKPVINSIVQDCSAYSLNASAVLSNPKRWAAPEVACPTLQPSLRVLSHDFSNFTAKELAWAAHNGRQLITARKAFEDDTGGFFALKPILAVLSFGCAVTNYDIP